MSTPLVFFLQGHPGCSFIVLLANGCCDYGQMDYCFQLEGKKFVEGF